MANLNRIRRKRFGEILVGDGLITKDQLQEALQLQKTSGDFLGAILLDLGCITESDIIKTLSVQYQIPFLRPSLYDIDRRLVEKFKPDFLHLHKVLPIDQIGNLLLLVVTDIPSDEVLAQIQETTQANLAIYIGSMSEVDQILKEMMPVSEEEQDRIRGRRKGVLEAASAPSIPAALKAAQDGADAEPGSDSIFTKVLTMDTSWESIFDAADVKVKGDDDK